MKPKLSILVPGIAERAAVYNDLMGRLFQQARGEPVEVISLLDNRSVSLSRKRNTMMDLAQGKFIVHLDDDDDVSDDFVNQIVKMAVERPRADVITYSQEATLSGSNPFIVSTSLKFENEEAREVDGRWVDIRRKPWHWSAWSRNLTKGVRFEEARDEDWRWLSQLLKRAKREHRTDKVLHYYRFDRAISTFEKKD